MGKRVLRVRQQGLADPPANWSQGGGLLQFGRPQIGTLVLDLSDYRSAHLRGED
jgi:hypothetical protein